MEKYLANKKSYEERREAFFMHWNIFENRYLYSTKRKGKKFVSYILFDLGYFISLLWAVLFSFVIPENFLFYFYWFFFYHFPVILQCWWWISGRKVPFWRFTCFNGLSPRVFVPNSRKYNLFIYLIHFWSIKRGSLIS